MKPRLLDLFSGAGGAAAGYQRAGFEVLGFQAGAAALDGEQFTDMKAEAYWACRKYFEDDEISCLNDEETEEQLGTIQYTETNRGKTQIERKEDARDKRGVKSPDRAEALIMAFMPITPRHQQQVYEPPGGYLEQPW